MTAATTQQGALLDADTPDTIRMTPEAAGELAVSALKRVGFTDEDAGIIADQLVDNALCGYRFASLPRILAIAGNNKTQNERRPIKVVHETPLSALIDGGNNLGYVSVYKATEVAINKARDRGFAMVGVYDSYYSGRSAYFMEMIAKAGFVGIHAASTR
ncbi:MAG TPA: Ldh family oxidoreductase, partial [Burkholderiales bacterium]|nr:Ldh family oxidoreductase [Burkholderiales bacterium]